MPDNDKVDGFTDVEQPQTENERQDPHDAIPGSPDPGREPHAPQPLDPDEYARLEKEAREENPEKAPK